MNIYQYFLMSRLLHLVTHLNFLNIAYDYEVRFELVKRKFELMNESVVQVIPPGMDFTNVVVQEETLDGDGELASLAGGAEGSSPKAVPTIWSDVSFHKASLLSFKVCFVDCV